MRPDMHDRYDSISLLHYVPPETTDDPLVFPLPTLLSFFFCILAGGAHEAVEGVVCVSS